MYRAWPFFRTVIDNLEQVLAKVDFGIARRYAELAREVPAARELLPRIEAEFARARRAVCEAKGVRRLLEGDRDLARSLALRRPWLAPRPVRWSCCANKRRRNAGPPPRAGIDASRQRSALDQRHRRRACRSRLGGRQRSGGRWWAGGSSRRGDRRPAAWKAVPGRRRLGASRRGPRRLTCAAAGSCPRRGEASPGTVDSTSTPGARAPPRPRCPRRKCAVGPTAATPITDGYAAG
jgi:hypothetical protein